MEKKILIIEDEPAIVELTTLALRDAGYAVYSAVDPDKIYHYVKSVLPDLILLDINLWGLNGKIVCEYIKSYEGLKQIPILVMSASSNIEKITAECGADGSIKKPFDLEDLISTVARYLTL